MSATADDSTRTGRRFNARCLVCEGRGTHTARLLGAPTTYDCGVCSGRGRVRLDVIASVHDLRAAEYSQLIGTREAFLASAATGDLHHLEDPVAWLAQRGTVVYRITGPRDPQCHAAGAPPSREDHAAWRRYREALQAIWRAWLEERGWEHVSSTLGDAKYRSPSGAVYPLTSGRSSPALDVALAREHFDIGRVLAEMTAVAGRVRARLLATRRHSAEAVPNGH